MKRYFIVFIFVFIFVFNTEVYAQEKDVYIEEDEYTISLKVDNEWKNNYQATVTIQNTSNSDIPN